MAAVAAQLSTGPYMRWPAAEFTRGGQHWPRPCKTSICVGDTCASTVMRYLLTAFPITVISDSGLFYRSH